MARDTERQKKAALELHLKTMFKRLEARRAPDHLIDLVDQLAAADRPVLKKAG